jgi:CRP/FNR family transcriptional regulator, nitrogen oxide reductase regulator
MLGGQSADQGVAPRLMSIAVGESEASRRAAFLVQHSPLFAGVSVAECREILSAAHEKHFERRQTIFLEGDPVKHLILLTSGSAKIVQFGQNGTEVILWLKGPGEVVGAVGLHQQGCHCSMALALRASSALVWDAAVFDSMSQRSTVLRRNITHTLCQQLQELEERYREISTERVAVRLSNQLVRLLHQVGRPVNGSVEISLSREELAQLTGTTLFTVSRLLSAWNQRGIVNTRREAVSVLNFQALAQLAEGQ